MAWMSNTFPSPLLAATAADMRVAQGPMPRENRLCGAVGHTVSDLQLELERCAPISILATKQDLRMSTREKARKRGGGCTFRGDRDLTAATLCATVTKLGRRWVSSSIVRRHT